VVPMVCQNHLPRFKKVSFALMVIYVINFLPIVRSRPENQQRGEREEVYRIPKRVDLSAKDKHHVLGIVLVRSIHIIDKSSPLTMIKFKLYIRYPRFALHTISCSPHYSGSSCIFKS
jgi:hypothetical protein